MTDEQNELYDMLNKYNLYNIIKAYFEIKVDKIKLQISNLRLNFHFWFINNTYKIVLFSILLRIFFVKYLNLYIQEDYMQIVVDFSNAVILGSFLNKLMYIDSIEIEYIILKKINTKFTKRNDLNFYVKAFKSATKIYGDYTKLNENTKKEFEDHIIEYMNHEPTLEERLVSGVFQNNP